MTLRRSALPQDRCERRHGHSGLSGEGCECVAEIVDHEGEPRCLFELDAPARACSGFVLEPRLLTCARRQPVEDVGVAPVQFRPMRSWNLAGEKPARARRAHEARTDFAALDRQAQLPPGGARLARAD